MTTPAQEPTEEKALVKITAYMEAPPVKARFAAMMGDQGASTYIASVLIAVANAPELQECAPASIYTSALRAATLRLSVDPGIGQAYMVRFGRKANLIVGYKGLHDMAVRTGKYRYINCGPIYEGEEAVEDRLSGLHHIELRPGERGEGPRKVKGWLAAFEMYTGYSHTLYMSIEEIHEHAKKYSASYHSGPWKTETAKMEKKTVLRSLLRHWGYMDPADVAILDAIDNGAEDTEATIDVLAETLSERDEDVEPEAPRTREDNLRDLGFPPEPARVEWPAEKLQVLVAAKLATNDFAAKGMLGLSNLRPDDKDETIKLWGTLYREKRGTKPTKDSPSSADAAAYANSALPR